MTTIPIPSHRGAPRARRDRHPMASSVTGRMPLHLAISILRGRGYLIESPCTGGLYLDASNLALAPNDPRRGLRSTELTEGDVDRLATHVFYTPHSGLLSWSELYGMTEAWRVARS